MKRIDNLYSKITDIKNITDMYDKRISINTKNKVKVERFDEHYVSNIARIKEILESRKYKPYKYNIFLIREPKVRLIMAQSITDKIINHLVSKYFLVDVFEPMLIENNIAMRVGKGTHVGIKKLKECLRKNINKDIYILKYDVKKYFFNLDHDILKNIIKKKIKDKDAINILDTIIDSTNEDYINKTIINIKNKEKNKIKNSNITNKKQLIEELKKIPLCKKGKSVPIGNMSSQTFAVLYGHEIDLYIVEKLKPILYLRYNDDGILISNNKEYLEYCLKELKKLMTKYKLELNSKTRIYHIDDGFEFLGFKYIRKNGKLIVKLKNQTKKRFKRKIKNIYKLYINNKYNLKDLKQVKMSYLGHLKYGNTNNLVKVTLDRYEKDRYYDLGYKVIINECNDVIICDKDLE